MRPAASLRCSGWLPGNTCKAESGYGYIKCDAGVFCKNFGLPAKGTQCATTKLCNKMCEAADSYGGRCSNYFYAPGKLTCDGVFSDVTVLRNMIIIPRYGNVSCDYRIMLGGASTDKATEVQPEYSTPPPLIFCELCGQSGDNDPTCCKTQGPQVVSRAAGMPGGGLARQAPGLGDPRLGRSVATPNGG
jgi:hypothetical protein